MQRRRFDPPLGRIFPVECILPLELTWVLTPFSKNPFRWEHKLRSSLCTHAFHRTDWKDPDIHVLGGWMPATKAHPACTIHEDGMWLPQWLDQKTVLYTKNLTQNGDSQRSCWWTQKKKSNFDRPIHTGHHKDLSTSGDQTSIVLMHRYPMWLTLPHLISQYHSTLEQKNTGLPIISRILEKFHMSTLNLNRIHRIICCCLSFWGGIWTTGRGNAKKKNKETKL